MGRGQMRNLERLGVGTGDINEFEYQKNQGELTEQLEHQGDREGAVPEATTTAERVQQVIADAHEKVEERKRKGLNRAAKKKAPARKAAAKKPAAKKLTSKRSPAKKSTQKSAARKSAKTSTTKSAAKKSTKKVAAKKSTARKR